MNRSSYFQQIGRQGFGRRSQQEARLRPLTPAIRRWEYSREEPIGGAEMRLASGMRPSAPQISANTGIKGASTERVAPPASPGMRLPAARPSAEGAISPAPFTPSPSTPSPAVASRPRSASSGRPVEGSPPVQTTLADATPIERSPLVGAAAPRRVTPAGERAAETATSRPESRLTGRTSVAPASTGDDPLPETRIARSASAPAEALPVEPVPARPATTPVPATPTKWSNAPASMPVRERTTEAPRLEPQRTSSWTQPALRGPAVEIGSLEIIVRPPPSPTSSPPVSSGTGAHQPQAAAAPPASRAPLARGFWAGYGLRQG